MYIRINSTDYNGRIMIEKYYGRSEYDWAVPAWEELGYPEFEGPFATVEEARHAVIGDSSELNEFGPR